MTQRNLHITFRASPSYIASFSFSSSPVSFYWHFWTVHSPSPCFSTVRYIQVRWESAEFRSSSSHSPPSQRISAFQSRQEWNSRSRAHGPRTLSPNRTRKWGGGWKNRVEPPRKFLFTGWIQSLASLTAPWVSQVRCFALSFPWAIFLPGAQLVDLTWNRHSYSDQTHLWGLTVGVMNLRYLLTFFSLDSTLFIPLLPLMN